MEMEENFHYIAGAEFPLQWPQTFGVLSVPSVDIVQELLKTNPKTTITEKLDGSNLCVSSSNWVASRRRILLVNPTKEHLEKTKFCGQPLTSLHEVIPKLKEIKEFIEKKFPDMEFEVLLYGEWIQKGTSSSQVDKFNYVNRSIKVGHLYAFGLTLHFKNPLKESQIELVENLVQNDYKWNCITVTSPLLYFVISMSNSLKAFLESYQLECVPLLAEVEFRNALSTPDYVNNLMGRNYEGYVLSTQNKLFKWKAFDIEERTSQRDALKIMETRLTDSSLQTILANLTKVCESATPEEKQDLGPRRKPTKALYASLFISAASKFPILEDMLDITESDNVKLLEVIKAYEATIYVEMVKDFLDAGYKLDKEYENELRGSLRAKVKVEAQKVLKRKLPWE